MRQGLEELRRKAIQDIQTAKDSEALNQIRVKVLGKRLHNYNSQRNGRIGAGRKTGYRRLANRIREGTGIRP